MDQLTSLYKQLTETNVNEEIEDLMEKIFDWVKNNDQLFSSSLVLKHLYLSLKYVLLQEATDCDSLQKCKLLPLSSLFLSCVKSCKDADPEIVKAGAVKIWNKAIKVEKIVEMTKLSIGSALSLLMDSFSLRKIYLELADTTPNRTLLFYGYTMEKISYSFKNMDGLFQFTDSIVTSFRGLICQAVNHKSFPKTSESPLSADMPFCVGLLSFALCYQTLIISKIPHGELVDFYNQLQDHSSSSSNLRLNQILEVCNLISLLTTECSNKKLSLILERLGHYEHVVNASYEFFTSDTESVYLKPFSDVLHCAISHCNASVKKLLGISKDGGTCRKLASFYRTCFVAYVGSLNKLRKSPLFKMGSLLDYIPKNIIDSVKRAFKLSIFFVSYNIELSWFNLDELLGVLDCGVVDQMSESAESLVDSVLRCCEKADTPLSYSYLSRLMQLYGVESILGQTERNIYYRLFKNYIQLHCRFCSNPNEVARLFAKLCRNNINKFTVLTDIWVDVLPLLRDRTGWAVTDSGSHPLKQSMTERLEENISEYDKFLINSNLAYYSWKCSDKDDSLLSAAIDHQNVAVQILTRLGKSHRDELATSYIHLFIYKESYTVLVQNEINIILNGMPRKVAKAGEEAVEDEISSNSCRVYVKYEENYMKDLVKAFDICDKCSPEDHKKIIKNLLLIASIYRYFSRYDLESRCYLRIFRIASENDDIVTAGCLLTRSLLKMEMYEDAKIVINVIENLKSLNSYNLGRIGIVRAEYYMLKDMLSEAHSLVTSLKTSEVYGESLVDNVSHSVRLSNISSLIDLKRRPTPNMPCPASMLLDSTTKSLALVKKMLEHTFSLMKVDNVTGFAHLLKYDLFDLLIDQLLMKGDSLYLVGAAREARQFYREGLRLVSQLQMSRRVLTFLGRLATLEFESGDFNQAQLHIAYYFIILTSEDSPNNGHLTLLRVSGIGAQLNSDDEERLQDSLLDMNLSICNDSMVSSHNYADNSLSLRQYSANDDFKLLVHIPSVHHSGCKCPPCNDLPLLRIIFEFLMIKDKECHRIYGEQSNKKYFSTANDRLCSFKYFPSLLQLRKDLSHCLSLSFSYSQTEESLAVSSHMYAKNTVRRYKLQMGLTTLKFCLVNKSDRATSLLPVLNRCRVSFRSDTCISFSAQLEVLFVLFVATYVCHFPLEDDCQVVRNPPAPPLPRQSGQPHVAPLKQVGNKHLLYSLPSASVMIKAIDQRNLLQQEVSMGRKPVVADKIGTSADDYSKEIKHLQDLLSEATSLRCQPLYSEMSRALSLMYALSGREKMAAYHLAFGTGCTLTHLQISATLRKNRSCEIDQPVIGHDSFDTIRANPDIDQFMQTLSEIPKDWTVVQLTRFPALPSVISASVRAGYMFVSVLSSHSPPTFKLLSNTHIDDVSIYMKIVLKESDATSFESSQSKWWRMRYNLNDTVGKITEYLEYVVLRDADLGEWTRTKHLVMIVDGDMHQLPWESMPSLRGRSVTRMPSYRSLLFMLRHNRQQPDSLYNSGVDLSSVYYVLNPSSDLVNSGRMWRDRFESYANWEGKSDAPPTLEEVADNLTRKDLLIYCGHGSGSRYIPGWKLQRINCRSAVLLLGCSSGRLSNGSDRAGGCSSIRDLNHSNNSIFDSYGPIFDYYISGCPLTISNLWDVTDKDIDRFLEGFLDAGFNKKVEFVSDAVSAARDKCKLPFLIGSAPVLYGLPLRFV